MFLARAGRHRPGPPEVVRVSRVLGFLLLAVLLLGCSAAPAPAPASSGAFTTTDVAWLQLAEALHTRALPLLDLARDRAADRPLSEFAARLGKAHESGRGRLRALLAQARITGENPHARHDMPGMPTAADLTALSVLRDDAFDRRFVALLRAYLKQLALVAKGEQGAGGARQARELASAMRRDHAADLAELDRIAGRT
ncbi:DUF305 domain-containing protein [Nonomuraea deserti]|uniref:DUF305 domain-containing protein n=1 Tax=Nonomuraea deserti TaxID=1848322 RepID=A0A4R4V5Q9_9ACTN|nr:DUF305 domain-containing protein [Nonomuraea deserti]